MDAGYDDPSDLVERAAAGDDQAWGDLVDRFAPLVYAVCRGFNLSADDAADVTQTVWLRLAENIASIHEPSRVGAWLVTTAKRECLSLQRSRARYEPLVIDLRESGADAPETVVLRHEVIGEVAAAFGLLTARCRELLRRAILGTPDSYKAISEAMSMPVGAIGPTRSRCLDQLRGIMNGAVSV